MTTNQNSERSVSYPTGSGPAGLAPGQAGPPPSGPPTPRASPVPGRTPDAGRPAAAFPLTAMLEARSVALVGASPRPGSFGRRMVEEVTRSPSRPEVHLVNPRHAEIGGRRCVPSLADLAGPVDLVLLAVPDAALEEQLTLAARRGDRSAVIFGNAHEDPALNSGLIANSGLTPAANAQPGATPSPPSGLIAHSGLTDPGVGGTDSSSLHRFMASSPNNRATTPGLDEPAGLMVPEGTAGSPGPLRDRLAAVARSAGMQLCGAGCMGFVNVTRGLRAIGYTEPDPLPAGPVALVTHSGSVFSAMLRARRGIGYTLAVSSGQELVTTTAAYLDYALGLPETKVVALVLEAIREPDRLRRALARAAERDIPVVLLTVGRSASGAMMVNAHSGALAADDGGWEALARAYGVHRVGDLAELADAAELFAIGRRAARGAGIATVHDSGLERAHAADLAEDAGVPFAAIGETTKARLAEILDPGLVPANPLDVWGTGADTRELFCRSLVTLARDPSVSAVALAVDLVRELDGDDSYPQAVLDAAAQTTKPLVVLGNLAAAVDQDLARGLREHGVPVLEGLRTGLLALRHLLDRAARSPACAPDPVTVADSPSAFAAAPGQTAHGALAAHGRTTPAGADSPSAFAAAPGQTAHGALAAHGQTTPAGAGPDGPAAFARRATPGPDRGRRDRAAALLAAGPAGPALLALLREYGIAAAAAAEAGDQAGALAAAESIGYPVVLKTADPSVTHKSDAGGVILGIRDPAELARAYARLSARLGPRVLVCQSVPPGTELAVGIARDPDLGPLIVVGAGGVLVELLADRAVALPPVDERTARQMIGELRAARLLDGVRGAPPADLGAVVRAITGVSALAEDLGDRLAALDVNPLICGPRGAVAVDALAVLRDQA
jgi:acetate---CoA ligase (ADP-forming)